MWSGLDSVFPAVPSSWAYRTPCRPIHGQLVLGGVRFPCYFEDGTEGWQMDFYQAVGEGRFKKLFSGPKKMKDIRLLELADGRVLVLTRPSGAMACTGRIGYVVVDSLEDVSVETIDGAKMLEVCALLTSGWVPMRRTSVE